MRPSAHTEDCTALTSAPDRRGSCRSRPSDPLEASLRLSQMRTRHRLRCGYQAHAAQIVDECFEIVNACWRSFFPCVLFQQLLRDVLYASGAPEHRASTRRRR